MLGKHLGRWAGQRAAQFDSPVSTPTLPHPPTGRDTAGGPGLGSPQGGREILVIPKCPPGSGALLETREQPWGPGSPASERSPSPQV